MKARITQLKAPWPSGAKVGDVIELDFVPVWAVGKCEQVSADAEVTVSFAAPVFVVNPGSEAEAEAKPKAEPKAKAEAKPKGDGQ